VLRAGFGSRHRSPAIFSPYEGMPQVLFMLICAAAARNPLPNLFRAKA
jgi:hypothetical protein